MADWRTSQGLGGGGERGQNGCRRRHVSKWTLGIAALLRVLEGQVLRVKVVFSIVNHRWKPSEWQGVKPECCGG